MKRGPRPVPTKIRERRGNPSRRPLPKGEAAPDVAVPECPDGLGEEARREWFRLAGELAELGLISRLDRAALTMLCTAWERYRAAEDKVAELGLVVTTHNGNPIQNPYLAIANRAFEQLRQMISEFGLSPAQRTRVKAGELKEEDPLVQDMLG